MLCNECTSVNRNNFEGRASILRCKRWRCDMCRDFNRWNVIKAARRGKPTTFLTLTCNPLIYDCPDEAARDLVNGWFNLRRLIRRKFKVKSVPFIAVFERTKLGWPHMHILMRAPYVPQGWISKQMARLIGAPICDIRALQDQGRAAAYVAKYIGKDLSAFVGCKRWWRSHDYQVEKEEEYVKVYYGQKTEIINVNYEAYKASVLKYGGLIADEGVSWFYFQTRWKLEGW